ncbi:MAG: diguanylate cyclase [Gammaproteobacteria bacterium]|nr:diguanylate cyclase [Gammaproteobacteria bacterium]
MYSPSFETQHDMLANVPIGIAITDDEGLVLWYNKTLASWTGADTDTRQYLGQPEATLLHCDNPDDRPTSPTNPGPYRLASGRLLMRCPVTLTDACQAISYLDVSEEEELRKERNYLVHQLEAHNTVEPLSGLLNQQAITHSLEPLVTRSRRYQNPLSVITMEVTNLAQLKQDWGQVPADKLVVVISHLLRDQLRWADLIGRIDSGQFVLVLPETHQKAAITLSKKIGGMLHDLQIQVNENSTQRAEACFGVSTWGKGDDAKLLLARSAEAVAIAASSGSAYSVKAVDLPASNSAIMFGYGS